MNFLFIPPKIINTPGDEMPKRIKPLTEKQVTSAKPADKPRCLFDGYGLCLLITPTGGKLWRYKYKFGGKAKSISFGAYPEVTLSEARELQNQARCQLEEGLDPSAVRKEQQQREKSNSLSGDSMPHITIAMDGMTEIWKGRSVVRLSKEEARFVKDLLILVR